MAIRLIFVGAPLFTELLDDSLMQLQLGLQEDELMWVVISYSIELVNSFGPGRLRPVVVKQEGNSHI